MSDSSDLWDQFNEMNQFAPVKMKVLCVSGREGLAEVRDGAPAEEVCGADPSAVPGGLEEQRDEDQTESRRTLLH